MHDFMQEDVHGYGIDFTVYVLCSIYRNSLKSHKTNHLKECQKVPTNMLTCDK